MKFKWSFLPDIFWDLYFAKCSQFESKPRDVWDYLLKFTLRHISSYRTDNLNYHLLWYHKSRMIKALNLVSIKRENSLSMIELHPSNMGRDDEATQKYNSYCTQYTSGRSPRMPTNHGNKCRYFVLWSFWLVKITSSTLKLARTSKFYPFYKQTRLKNCTHRASRHRPFCKVRPQWKWWWASNFSYFMKS